ncbi:phenylalanine--tRNA ligase subunit alpha [Parasphingopyxis sp.]|uniref:phenylalanine--tRNA ligase subunit alpha n=1 Tax=Parasphingopyxis sp. TaxID=1920299 RepID=UPI00261B0191|nr:phenylalanine--tRNA ligase subunit alpha [Parasphingopyxis sp.]
MMDQQKPDLEQLKQDLSAAIDVATGLDTLDAVRVHALGKNGVVTNLLKTLGGMSPEERKVEGPRINGLRSEIAGAIEAKKDALAAEELAERMASETLDLSLPPKDTPKGSVHPVSQVMDELAEIFADLGFAVATGPEIEDDWHNFTALNIPESHPARAMHDTFYFGENQMRDGMPMMLRTHTSPVQIRTMTSGEPPFRIIAPGRTYRSDSDATHTPMFHQVEGLVIDRDITMGHLKWTLETFVKAFFERDDIVLRFRPSYFPFTEPSAEIDMGFSVENGRRIVGGDPNGPDGGWMELGGSGMVNRHVIAACNLDPDEWQGFAFGCGIDRLAMLKYGMDDLRAFFDGDLRWIEHYGFSALDVPTLSAGVGA